MEGILWEERIQGLAGLAQKTQPSFTHPVLYGFTQLEKHRKTRVQLGFIKKQRNLRKILRFIESLDMIMIL